jgi:hypothetical protein
MDNIILAFCFCFLPFSLHKPFVPFLIIPLWIYFSSFLVFVILSRSLRGWELKRLEVKKWKLGGQGWSQLWCLSWREEQAKGKGKGGEQIPVRKGFGGFILFFPLVETNYRTLSPTEGIFHLLLND